MNHADLWGFAGEADVTLQLPSRSREPLHAARLRTMSYTRDRLFKRMAHGLPSLFTNVPVSIGTNIKRNEYLAPVVVAAIRNGFPRTARARIQIGASRRRTTVPVSDLMDYWETGNHRLGVTDLHFRDTRFDRSIDTTVLSDFNIFRMNRSIADRLEMMTLVASTRGNVTDSHTDDSDGSNHCFVGRKLWLVWDRIAGQELGLQDVTHDDVTDVAAFDMQTFLRTAGARWFVVERGKTLFLPGSLAHKVVTLDQYIGLGSFYFALASSANTLARWILDDPRDVTPKLLAQTVGVDVQVMQRVFGVAFKLCSGGRSRNSARCVQVMQRGGWWRLA